ncbi:endocuticle structural glycoprotein ABD-4-like isoform X3 [Schistocerca gregaria]|uniref:endocuticle structural glycoprotein ABD-4-like isoform X2 n=1 Tax=Schistocerca gregaria TaxID=7010 RepID=UPI00211E631E|nr:endocuticle structural glycoprotein ABD-4-like isoform X2 [Schistocerca gregaria]XP_049839555.1 endocuticle structural glycoprotein ABD-4-like isoform X3 [Schistocerca gregaria]
MYKLLVLSALVAVAMGAVAEITKDVVPIVKQENVISPEGNFHYLFESGDGTRAEEDGTLVKSQDPKVPDTIAVRGSVSYTAPDGTPVQFTYTADENGFRPEGAHIPVAPPVPEAIARALQYIAEHPPPPEVVAARTQ